MSIDRNILWQKLESFIDSQYKTDSGNSVEFEKYLAKTAPNALSIHFFKHLLEYAVCAYSFHILNLIGNSLLPICAVQLLLQR